MAGQRVSPTAKPFGYAQSPWRKLQDACTTEAQRHRGCVSCGVIDVAQPIKALLEDTFPHLVLQSSLLLGTLPAHVNLDNLADLCKI